MSRKATTKATKARSRHKTAGAPIEFDVARVAMSSLAAPDQISSTLSPDSGTLTVLFPPLRVESQSRIAPLAAAQSVCLRIAVKARATSKLAEHVCDLRGSVGKSAGARALVFIDVAGKPTSIEFPYGKAIDGKEIWRRIKTRNKVNAAGDESYTLTILLVAERRTTEDFVLLTVDSVDITGSAR